MAGDYDRELGVIEAFMVITRQCPNGAVRACAEQALEVAKQGADNPQLLHEQAFLVLTAMRGWRGERASQVSRSLSAFVNQSQAGAG